MRNDRRKDAVRVEFEPALKVRIMAIDGTWARECLLIDASDTGAQIALVGPATSTQEFFLVLSSIGIPVFRRCKRAWTEGDRIGVSFDKKGPQAKPKPLSRDLEITQV
jgi:hypothetical protein